MSKLRDLKRKQLSDSIKAGISVPVSKLGQSLRDIREALGMTQKQLARKMGTSQAQVSRIEEDPSTTTLNTLDRFVSVLGLNLSAFVTSDKSLLEIISQQAQKKGEQMIKRTFANMAMEKQSPEKDAYNFQLKKLAAELVADPGSELWEE